MNGQSSVDASPKGRTRQRRARKIVLTGVDAIQHARAREGLMGGGINDPDNENEASSASDISIRRRRKRRNASFDAGSFSKEHIDCSEMMESRTEIDVSEVVYNACSEERALSKPIHSSHPPSTSVDSMNCQASVADDADDELKTNLGEICSTEDFTGGSQLVALGSRGYCNDSNTAQDLGSYRMLVDDLSYLCSAVNQCRGKPLKCGPEKIIYKHTPVTAGAACDIAELISQPSARAKMLTPLSELKSQLRGSEGVRVVALDAVLESISSAPNVPNLSAVCRRLILGQDLSVETHGTQGISAEIADPVSELSSTALPPLKSPAERAQNDSITAKALSIISYFVGIDCTSSERSSILAEGPTTCLAVHLVRNCVVQHKPALQGIARLVANDPVVHAYLYKASIICGLSNRCYNGQPRSISSGFIASCNDDGLNVNKSFDPTKSGRQRKKRNPSNGYGDPSRILLDHFPLKGLIPNPTSDRKSEGKKNCLDVTHNNLGSSSRANSSIELNSKYYGKLALALTRSKLSHAEANGVSHSQSDFPLACAFCNDWIPSLLPDLNCNRKQFSFVASSIALKAADCIITGKDKLMTGLNASESHHCDDDDICPLSSVLDGASMPGVLDENPIVHTNEMFRLSGSLHHYSHAMSETLVAILISFKYSDLNKNGKTCSKCVTYLQRRSASLSEVIDSLCCLSPNVSIALSHEELLLVPSLLRSIAELSFGVESNGLSLYSESISTSLKTLTSLTHENVVACNQMFNPFCWEVPSLYLSCVSPPPKQITGLDIIFSHLFKTVSLTKVQSGVQKGNYDNTIFCLNILTNTVEMAPYLTKIAFEKIFVDESCGAGNAKVLGLSWLARWVVSKTSGFRLSLMNGSFGSKSGSSDDDESSGLRLGEEDNLVISGNGFVLLACLMMDDGRYPSCSIRDIVVKELPTDIDGKSGGIKFMVKMLKAFCNFYHYSVGDLSVAVIAPVMKLIAGLEKFDPLS